MKSFTILTLIDITETKQYRKEPGKDLERQQQQNFAVLLQTIGLRVNPIYDSSPMSEEINLKNQNFGSFYSGSHRVWKFHFNIEFEGGFTDKLGNEAGLLINDLHFVPITSNLNETIELPLPVFDTQSTDYLNTLIYPKFI